MGGKTKKEEKYVPPNAMSAEKQRRYLQCWLADNLLSVSSSKPSSYKNFYNMLGESRSVRNKLISIKGVSGFFDIPGYKLASLVPRFRLFKEGSKSSAEFVFEDQIQHVDQITASKMGRGANVGFKSFSYEMKGGSPATAESLVEAKLVIHFASLSDLFAHRGQSPAFSDLLGQPSRLKKGQKCVITAQDKEKAKNSDYYKISVELGYSVPNKSWGDSDLAEQVSNVSRTMSLTLVQHSIDFREDGSIQLELEYQAYVDKLLIDADVFDLALSKAQRVAIAGLEKKQCMDQQGVDKQKKKPSQNCGAKGEPPVERDLSDEEEAKKDELEDSKQKVLDAKSVAYAALFEELFKRQQVYRINVSAENFMKGQKSPQAASVKDPDVKESAVEGMKKLSAQVKDRKGGIMDWSDSGKTNIKENVNGEDGGHHGGKKGAGFTIEGEGTGVSSLLGDWGDINPDSKIPITYVFFGDLLDAAFACTHNGDPKFKNLKFLVGTFPYGKNGAAAVDVPLANIPISIQLFQAWFADHVLLKERSSYPLKSFIADVFGNLVRPALSQKNCFGTSHLIPRLGIETVEAPQGGKGQCQVTKGSVSKKSGTIKGSNVAIKYAKSGKGSANRPTVIYYYIYATSIKQVNKKGEIGVAQKSQDQANGVYWLKAGSESGLVKKVTFKKTDQAGVKEARIESEGPSGSGFLIDRYNADIEMYGTSLFKPGMTVFIDPITSAIESERTEAIRIGLGGYYKVTQVSTAMEAGVYKTDLTCVWESKSASSGGSARGGCK